MIPSAKLRQPAANPPGNSVKRDELCRYEGEGGSLLADDGSRATSPRGLSGEARPAAFSEQARIAEPPPGFRRLQKDEIAQRGDFVMNNLQEVDSWEGPGGFRAGSFVMPIYRRVTGLHLMEGGFE
jgi:hypothetical protein